MTSRNAFVVDGPVTGQLNDPVFAIDTASESNGPPAPVRDSSRSTTVTATLSVALHDNVVVEPIRSASPGSGARTCTAGRVVSANVAVSETLLVTVSGSGSVVLT